MRAEPTATLARRLRRGLWQMVLLGAVGCTPMLAADPKADPIKARAVRRFVLGTARTPEPRLPPPGKGEHLNHPRFGTTIVRATDQKRDGYEGKGIQNEYARADPENADGTLLVLRGTEAQWNLYSARSFKRLRVLSELGRGGQEPEPRWDAVRPSVLYHLQNMRLLELDVISGKERVVRDFAGEFPEGSYLSSGNEGDASVDRRFFCLMVKDLEYKVQAAFVYDRSRDRLLGRRALPEDVDNVSMDMSGKHCVVIHGEGDGVSYSADFRRSVRLPDRSVGHADLALTAEGKDVLVFQDVKTDWITMIDLDTGQQTKLVSIPFEMNTDLGLHFSGNCARVPGWVLVSTYGARNPARGRPGSWMDRQLFMVELREEPRIWRIAHTHSILSVDPDGKKHYFAEAFATINTRGDRVYWGSNWGQRDLDRIELYVALLPRAWQWTLPGGDTPAR